MGLARGAQTRVVHGQEAARKRGTPQAKTKEGPIADGRTKNGHALRRTFVQGTRGEYNARPSRWRATWRAWWHTAHTAKTGGKRARGERVLTSLSSFLMVSVSNVFMRNTGCTRAKLIVVGGTGRAGGAAEGRDGGCKRDCLFWMDPIGVVIRYALTPGSLRALVISVSRPNNRLQ